MSNVFLTDVLKDATTSKVSLFQVQLLSLETVALVDAIHYHQ
jgi:hypothetical protein